MESPQLLAQLDLEGGIGGPLAGGLRRLKDKDGGVVRRVAVRVLPLVRRAVAEAVVLRGDEDAQLAPARVGEVSEGGRLLRGP